MSRKQYSPELWVTIRSLYESGSFSSLEVLYKHLKKSIPDVKIPTLQYIRQKAAEEGWNKHESDAELADKKAQTMDDMFSEFGMPTKERIRRNVMGITAIDEIVQEMHGALKSINKKIKDEDVSEEVMEKLDAVIKGIPKMSAGLKISLEYLKNAHALCGDNAPEKRQIITGSNSKNDKYDDMTEEELTKELSRLKKIEQAAEAETSKATKK